MHFFISSISILCSEWFSNVPIAPASFTDSIETNPVLLPWSLLSICCESIGIFTLLLNLYTSTAWHAIAMLHFPRAGAEAESTASDRANWTNINRVAAELTLGRACAFIEAE